MADIIHILDIESFRGKYIPKPIMRHYAIKRHCGEGILEAFIESNNYVVHHHVKRYGWDEVITTTGIRVTDTGYVFYKLAEGFN